MAGTIIETKALTKRYGALTAVDDLNLTVRQGEVFGLLGPNGAGKTTTTLMLLGLTEPTAGSASISGVDCTRNPIQVKRFVGYLPDNMGFYPDMTGRQNLRMTGAMNGLSGDYLEARIDELAARVGYTEYYLSRKFKEETGVSLNNYIKFAKVERAKFLLSSTDTSIQEISNRLGFCSRSYFGSTFQKIVGCSPADYREGNGPN